MNYRVVAFILMAVLGLAQGGPLKVANGTVEEPHSSPWQVKIYIYHGLTNIWPCGGTLISQNYVLTAARCFTYHGVKGTLIYAYLGIWDVQNMDTDGSLHIPDISVQNVTMHEGYNASTYENDIALIKLPSTIEYTDKIQPAKLASTRNVEIGDVAHISGWQYPEREWEPSHQYLHGGDVTVVENAVCQDTYPSHVIDEDVICASGTVAFCYGDEGIALPLNGEIIGMAYGAKDVYTPLEECPILPQTYLSIPKYLEWIKANSDYQDK